MKTLILQTEKYKLLCFMVLLYGPIMLLLPTNTVIISTLKCSLDIPSITASLQCCVAWFEATMLWHCYAQFSVCI